MKLLGRGQAGSGAVVNPVGLPSTPPLWQVWSAGRGCTVQGNEKQLICEGWAMNVATVSLSSEIYYSITIGGTLDSMYYIVIT